MFKLDLSLYILTYSERYKFFNFKTKLPRKHKNSDIDIWSRVDNMVWKNYLSLCNTFSNLSKMVDIIYPLVSRHLHDKLTSNFTVKKIKGKYQHIFSIFLTLVYKMRLFCKFIKWDYSSVYTIWNLVETNKHGWKSTDKRTRVNKPRVEKAYYPTMLFYTLPLQHGVHLNPNHFFFFFFKLTLSQTTNFRLFQTERVCRWQFQIQWKWEKVLQTGRKRCGKKKNCSLWAISPFPTVFSKGLYCRHVKTRACLGKG